MSEVLGIAEGHGAIVLLREPALQDGRQFELQPLGEMLRPQLERVVQRAFDTSPRKCPPTCDFRLRVSILCAGG